MDLEFDAVLVEVGGYLVLRCGTANAFCAVQPKAGRHFTMPTLDRSAPEFAQALDGVGSSYLSAQTIHMVMVMDNLNIHCQKSLTDYFGEGEGRCCLEPPPRSLHAQAG